MSGEGSVVSAANTGGLLPAMLLGIKTKVGQVNCPGMAEYTEEAAMMFYRIGFHVDGHPLYKDSDARASSICL